MAVTQTTGEGYALYNGIKLPVLPEWDKETYPYAYIFPYSGTYRLRVFSARMYYDEYTTSTGTAATAAAFRNEGAVLAYKITDGEWVLATSAPGSVLVYDTADPAGTRYSRMYYIWSNSDILDYNDGSVYLAATTPSPSPTRP